MDKKEKILAAAQEIFFKKSFYEATMDDIAQLSGIKKPTIYYYFPSKIDLASQLLEINMKNIFGQIDDIILSTSNIKEQIERIADFYAHFLKKHSKFFIIVQRIGYDFMHKEKSKKTMNCFFDKLLERQKRAGDFIGEVILSSGKKVSGNILLCSMISSFGRVTFEAVSHGDKPKKEEILAIRDIFIAAVK